MTKEELAFKLLTLNFNNFACYSPKNNDTLEEHNKRVAELLAECYNEIYRKLEIDPKEAAT